MASLLSIDNVKVTIMAFAMAMASTNIYAQTPKLKPLSEKDMTETIAPMEKKGLWGYANLKEKFVIKPVFNAAKPFIDGMALVCSHDKWGIIRRNAEYLVEPKYDEIMDFIGQIARVRNNGLYGVINRQGEEILACSLDNIEKQKDYKFYIIQKGDKYGTMDEYGKICLEPTMDKVIFPTWIEVPIIKKGNKFGCLTKQGIVIQQPIYDDVKSFTANRTLLKKDGLWALGNNSLQELTEAIFDEIKPLDGKTDVLVVSTHGKKGLLNIDGKYITEVAYDDIQPAKSGSMYVTRQGNLYGALDKNLKVICEPSLNTEPTSDYMTTKVSAKRSYGDMEYEITIDAPTFAQPYMKSAIGNWVNDVISNKFTGDKTDFVAMANDFVNNPTRGSEEEISASDMSITHQIELLNNEPKYITYTYAGYTYYTGAAHGIPSFFGFTFSKEDGKMIESNQIVKDTKSIMPLVIEGLMSYFEVGDDSDLREELMEEIGELSAPETLYLTPEGVVFVYQVYSIAPYSAGQPSATIPYSKIMPYLTQTAKDLISK